MPFDTALGAGFFEGDLELPAEDEPCEDLDFGNRNIGAEQARCADSGAQAHAGGTTNRAG